MCQINTSAKNQEILYAVGVENGPPAGNNNCKILPKRGDVLKIIIVLLFLLLLFIFPQNVSAQPLDRMWIYYHEICEDGGIQLQSYAITVPSWLDVQSRAFVVFSQIFDNVNEDKMLFVPGGVKILDVFFDVGQAHLTVNLSADISAYGGTFFESKLVEKIFANVRGIGDVEFLTILIEGELRYLPEGTLIHKNSLALF